jgi:carbamoyltransferase
VQHHLSHAAGTFFVSPYEHAAIMAIDGSGEWACAWLGEGRGRTVTCYNESLFPHSLGAVYEAVTEFCGFKPNYDEGKTMGLAPLGDASRFIDKARKTISVDVEGRLHVDLAYFSYQYWGYQRCSALFHQSFGSPRQAGAEFKPQHQDVAAAFQQVLEECALAMAAVLKRRSQARHLVIAGGVALNSVMNGRLLREAGFDDVYIMPAAGDNGTCIGAAYTVLHQELGQERCFVHDNPFIGNSYDDATIEHLLKQFKLTYRRSDNIAVDAASLLERGCILGWFQGRMEIGPRALGARSILANPACPDMKAKINNEVKFREAYRPFAPSSTVEAAQSFFDIDVEAPFMLKVCQVLPDKQSQLPAITHVDGSARLQTVRRETNPLYHELISQLGQHTGVPVVLNTSFNIQGEPVVESPRDAIRCFFSTGLDYLAIGSFIVSKGRDPLFSKERLQP